jgi:Ran GTPase-activating protein (RanGAP) involved in mRNA processing and transport
LFFIFFFKKGETNLNKNSLTLLCDSLKYNDTLQHLILESNKIENELIVFTEFFYFNNSLVSIDLSHNLINTQGIKFLSDSLRNNSGLTSLDLRTNHLEEDALLFLFDLLLFNNSITSLLLTSFSPTLYKIDFLCCANIPWSIQCHKNLPKVI